MWQGIETVPTDGRWVLLTGGKTSEDFYNTNDHDHSDRAVVAAWHGPDAYDDTGYWIVCYWDGAWRTEYEKPTHWMELPEPPK